MIEFKGSTMMSKIPVWETRKIMSLILIVKILGNADLGKTLFFLFFLSLFKLKFIGVARVSKVT